MYLYQGVCVIYLTKNLTVVSGLQTCVKFVLFFLYY